MRIIFFGIQGSGKSTQAKMLAQMLTVPYIEMGQLFRDKTNDNDTDAGFIRQALETGNLVPDRIAVETLHQRLTKSDCENGYVLDGYPRNFAQLEGLTDQIDRVFYVKVKDEEAIKRLIRRSREDDNLNVIQRRMELYHRESEPLLTYFKQQGKLVEINGEQSIAQVHLDIIDKIKNGKK